VDDGQTGGGRSRRGISLTRTAQGARALRACTGWRVGAVGREARGERREASVGRGREQAQSRTWQEQAGALSSAAPVNRLSLRESRRAPSLCVSAATAGQIHSSANDALDIPPLQNNEGPAPLLTVARTPYQCQPADLPSSSPHHVRNLVATSIPEGVSFDSPVAAISARLWQRDHPRGCLPRTVYLLCNRVASH